MLYFGKHNAAGQEDRKIEPQFPFVSWEKERGEDRTVKGHKGTAFWDDGETHNFASHHPNLAVCCNPLRTLQTGQHFGVVQIQPIHHQPPPWENTAKVDAGRPH